MQRSARAAGRPVYGPVAVSIAAAADAPATNRMLVLLLRPIYSQHWRDVEVSVRKFAMAWGRSCRVGFARKAESKRGCEGSPLVRSTHQPLLVLAFVSVILPLLLLPRLLGQVAPLGVSEAVDTLSFSPSCPPPRDIHVNPGRIDWLVVVAALLYESTPRSPSSSSLPRVLAHHIPLHPLHLLLVD